MSKPEETPRDPWTIYEGHLADEIRKNPTRYGITDKNGAADHGRCRVSDDLRGVVLHGWRVEFRHPDQETADQVNHAIAHLYEADGDQGLAAEFLWHRVLEHLEVTTARSGYDELLKQAERDLWEETAKYLPEDVHAAAVQHWEEGDEVFVVTKEPQGVEVVRQPEGTMFLQTIGAEFEEGDLKGSIGSTAGLGGADLVVYIDQGKRREAYRVSGRDVVESAMRQFKEAQ